MRPIKFKLLKDNRVVGYELHELFHDVVEKDAPQTKEIVILHQFMGSVSSCVVNTNYGKSLKHGFIPHDEKRQYTGMKDHNKREIYEGDILNVEYWIGDRDLAEKEQDIDSYSDQIVVFEMGAFGFRSKNIKKPEIPMTTFNPDHDPYNYRLKIIENIYEN